MRTITLAALLLATIACNRASAPPSVLESAQAPPDPEPTPIAGEQPEATVAAERHYCDVYPENCRPCEGEPGSCGGTQFAGACCCPDGGCVGVSLAGECPVACDYLPCEWGYQEVGPDGKPKFTCFD